MAKIGRPGLPEYERRRVWDLWKDGHSFSHNSRSVGAPPGSVFSIVKPCGSIYYPTPHPRPTSLTLTDREEISRGIAAGRSIRNIAEGLSRSPSTISREIRRNRGRKTYRAVDANGLAQRRRHRPQRLKLQMNPVLCNYVTARLGHCWSPEQITGRLHRDSPGNRRMHISPEAIYRSVYLNSGRKIRPTIFTTICVGTAPSGMTSTTPLVESGDRRSRTPDPSQTGLKRPMIAPKPQYSPQSPTRS